ncbi:MAG: glycosyltransferase family 39 protein [Candidatus Marsarchaeota archaeon]|nr:glycosyltransferase family 39 protein [Candidatus Marsarchaeota archaeon]MCL5095044.1 glycosyltransferase family 39 protein [Candidatus Marsarchaeota archaeon]
MLTVLFNLLNFLNLNQTSNQEYLFLIGILISFFGLIISAIFSFKDILKVFRSLHFKKIYILFIVLIVLIFLLLEFSFARQTQRIFFDDVIYQSMALYLLHTGEAVMCNYGTPYTCFSAQFFHEPIGTSFNLAIGFALFGINQITGYYTQLAIALISIFFVFLISFLLFKNFEASFFSSLIFALTPTLLVWAQPTTSDLEMMAYSLIAIFFMLIFIKQKNIKTFSAFAFSLALLSYMKIDAVFYLLLIPLMYIILDDKNLFSSIKNNSKRLVSLFKTSSKNDFLIIFLVIAIFPSLFFAYNQLEFAPFGSQHVSLQNTCNPSQTIFTNSKFSFLYFKMNICVNIYFWFNVLSVQGIYEPVSFTVFSIIGAIFMFIYKKREFSALLIWFSSLFVLYTSFYAGAVTFGSDWRFMLSLIAPASIFAGFCIFCIIFIFKDFIRILKKFIAKSYKKSKIAHIEKLSIFLIYLAIFLIVFYSLYNILPKLSSSSNPNYLSSEPARYYQNFVYNNSYLIPAKCLVFTFDPTLFSLNNKTSIQFTNLANINYTSNLSKQYSCIVVDYGYWCYTSYSNFCKNATKDYNLTAIKTSSYSTYKFGFYYLKMKNQT